MKKYLLLAVLFCLLASANHVSADNYFSLRTDITTPVNDTLRIPPSHAGSFCQMFVIANFDGYLDHWYVQFTYPDSMLILIENSGEDLSIPYTMSDGTNSVFNAVLTRHTYNATEGSNLLSSSYSATSTEYGYWDSNGDGIYELYGTVKWETGLHNHMFDFQLYIPNNWVDINVNITGSLSSTTDWRGVPTVSGPFQKTIHLKVAYLLGDTDGNNTLTVADVTTLIDWMLNGTDLTVYQFNAGDVNGDGQLSLADVSALLDLMHAQNMVTPDLSDLLTEIQ